MTQWEDDLREVVDEDGDALLRFAAVVCGTTDEGRRHVVDALAAGFRRGSPFGTAIGRDGAVTVRTDDAHSLVGNPVRRAVVDSQRFRDPRLWDGPEPLARISPDARACLVLRDEGRGAVEVARVLDVDASDATAWLATADAGLAAAGTTPRHVLAAVGSPAGSGLADEVASRVRDERQRARRTRRRALTTVAGVLVVVAAVSGTTVLRSRGGADVAAEPSVSPSASYVAFADTPSAPADCGRTVAADPALPTAMTVEGQTSRIVASGAWWGAYSLDDDALTAKERALADPGDLISTAVLVRHGVVVAQGVDDSSGGTTMDSGSGEVSAGAVDLGALPAPRFADYTDGGTFPVIFAPCGTTLASGSYEVRIVSATSDDQHWYLSNAVPLTVVATKPDGYQPPWLEGSALACGERVADFEARAALRPLSSLDPSVVAVEDHDVAYTFKNPARHAVSVTAPTQMGIAWVQGGRVVGVSPAEQSNEAPTKVGARSRITVRSAVWDATDYCRPSSHGTFTHRLPAGTYQVVAYGRFFAAGDLVTDPGGWATVASGPAKVIVAQDGSVRVG